MLRKATNLVIVREEASLSLLLCAFHIFMIHRLYLRLTLLEHNSDNQRLDAKLGSVANFCIEE